MNEATIQITGVDALGKGRRRIHFENGESCIVYYSETRSLPLEENAFIKQTEYDKLFNEIVGKRAKKRALHLLEQMDRTEKQLREKLLQSEYPSSCVEAAISYVKSFHYLDDLRYAQTFARYSKERLSRGQIRQKLLTKGVSKEFIEIALEEEYDADESEQIRKLLEKKHFDAETADDADFRKVYQYLLRRGFRSNDILKEMKYWKADW